MPVNELGKPGVPDMTDVFMGIPPAIKGNTASGEINGGQRMLALADQRNPQPVVDMLGKVITQPSHAVLVPNGKRRVTVIEDKHLQMPCLCLSVYVEGVEFEQKAFASMFVRALCRKAATPEEADLVVFTGGTDVDPALYGHGAYHKTDTPDRERDAREIALFQLCKKEGIPMLGVCRGAQFLHVMHGGVLYQDVDEHNRPHAIVTVSDGLIIPQVSSVHHQMIYPDPELGIRVIAVSSIANNRKMWKKDNVFTNTTDRKADAEVFFYRDTCTLGFQGHPEYTGYPEYTQWSMQVIEDWVCSNADCEWREDTKRYRLKQEFIDERDKMEKSIMSQAEAKIKPAKKATLTVPKAKAQKESK